MLTHAGLFPFNKRMTYFAECSIYKDVSNYVTCISFAFSLYMACRRHSLNKPKNIKIAYILPTSRYMNQIPLPIEIWELIFQRRIFLADCREFFQTNNKSNRQMMSVFIYSSSNL